MLLLSLFLSITGLARLILIILIGYAIYTLIVRIIVPVTVSNFLRKNFREYSQNEPVSGEKKKEGDISVQKAEGRENQKPFSEKGEYVEFEEIE